MTLERSSGKVTNLTESLDRWVNTFNWGPDSGRRLYTASGRGRQAIQIHPVAGGAAPVVASGDSELDDMQLTRNGKTMVYTQQSGVSPVEIYSVSSSGGAAVPLTRLNDQTLSDHQMTPLEEFWVDGAEGAKVQSFMIRPPNFAPGRKYPVLILIHGGPQGFWGHAWTYRWNAQVFAAAGYVVVMPNPRGSTGYGQKFIDEINNHCGGRAFDDIMAVADHIANDGPLGDACKMGSARCGYRRRNNLWNLGRTPPRKSRR